MTTTFCAFSFSMLICLTHSLESISMPQSIKPLQKALEILSVQTKTCSIVVTSPNEKHNLKNLFPMPIVLMTHDTGTAILQKGLLKCKSVVIAMSEPGLIVDILLKWKSVLPPENDYVFVGLPKETYEQLDIFAKYINAVYVTEEADRVIVWKRSVPFGKDLSTVVTPYPPLFPEIKDFRGARFVARAFDLPPYSTIDLKTGRFGGLEYQMAAAVAAGLNLRLEVKTPSDGLMWGSEDPAGSGNYTGLLGDFQFGRADIGYANLFVNLNRKTFMDFTDWYSLDEYCVAVPRPRYYSKIWSLVEPFDLLTWLGLLFSVALIIAFYWIYGLLNLDSKYVTSTYVIYALAAPLMQCHGAGTTVKGVRFATLIFLLAMLVLDLAYTSCLKSFLAVKISPSPMDSLKQLNSVSNSKHLDLFSCCPEVIDYFRNSLVPSNRELAKKFVVYPDHFQAMKSMDCSGYATIHTKNVLTFNIREYFIDKDGVATVHIMNECLYTIPIALGLQKQSPFRQAVNHKILQLREAGLLSKWVQDGAKSAGQLTVKKKVEETLEAFSLQQLQGIMMIAGVLEALAVMVFVGERL